MTAAVTVGGGVFYPSVHPLADTVSLILPRSMAGNPALARAADTAILASSLSLVQPQSLALSSKADAEKNLRIREKVRVRTEAEKERKHQEKVARLTAGRKSKSALVPADGATMGMEL